MRDGVHLAVDIYLPENTEGPIPVLLAMSAYGKNIQRQLLPQPMPSALGDACIEAGWSQDIVDRGYAHAIACTRGTGQSEGEYLSMYSEQESTDGYDLVEWLAVQDWCNGDVGMIGISYFGTIQLVVASSCPPSLKAIAPLEATTDQYLACYHGGVLDGFYSELFTGRHSTLGWSGFQPTNAKTKSDRFWDEAELDARIAELKADPSVNQYNLLYSVLDCPTKNTVMHDIMINAWDGNEYWWKPDLSKIEIPVLCGVAQFPDCGPKFVREPFMIFEGVKGPKQLGFHKPGWLDRPYHEYHDEVLDFFDHYIKGIDNGVDGQAPIRLFVSGDDTYRDEYEWPLARTEWTDFHLAPHARLTTTAPKFDTIEPDGYVQAPLYVTSEIASLDYSTGPLPADIEVTGPITLHLHADISATDSWFKAQIFERDPMNGSEWEVTHGHLRCSHRTLDESRTKHYQPFHKHDRDSETPVVPGEINEYVLELYPIAHTFVKGKELVLRISSGDRPGVQFSYHIMAGETVSYRIHRDRTYPSRLHLPVIPR
ncbi:CocE/NonD family hydrolase [Rhodococcus sp. Q1]|nr:CocE/NonD family hydrolase [Rhodococcus sp. Q1]